MPSAFRETFRVLRAFGEVFRVLRAFGEMFRVLRAFGPRVGLSWLLFASSLGRWEHLEVTRREPRIAAAPNSHRKCTTSNRMRKCGVRFYRIHFR